MDEETDDIDFEQSDVELRNHRTARLRIDRGLHGDCRHKEHARRVRKNEENENT